jgi:hypothetical protein
MIVRRFYVVPSSGKEDLVRFLQISCPMQSWICGSMHVRRMEEANKESEELVDVSPRWGEQRISYVMRFVIYCSCNCLVHYYDRYIYEFLVIMI